MPTHYCLLLQIIRKPKAGALNCCKTHEIGLDKHQGSLKTGGCFQAAFQSDPACRLRSDSSRAAAAMAVAVAAMVDAMAAMVDAMAKGTKT